MAESRLIIFRKISRIVYLVFSNQNLNLEEWPLELKMGFKTIDQLSVFNL